MMIEIRRADSQDVAQLAALRREYGTEMHSLQADADPGFEHRFLAWHERTKQSCVSWIATADAHAVGLLSLIVIPRMPNPDRHTGQLAYLPFLYVRPNHRNSGIGRRLLDAAFDHARKNDVAKIILRPTDQAVSLYRRAGFRMADDHLVWRS